MTVPSNKEVPIQRIDGDPATNTLMERLDQWRLHGALRVLGENRGGKQNENNDEG